MSGWMAYRSAWARYRAYGRRRFVRAAFWVGLVVIVVVLAVVLAR